MRTRALASALALACTSASAIAAPAPVARPGQAEVKSVERRAAVAPAAAPPSGPTVTLEDFLAVRRWDIDQITDAQIAKMRRLLEVTADDDPQKPDFWFRLGELCADKERAALGRARALDQPIHDAPAARRVELQAKQRGHEDAARRWRLQAVEAFVAASRFPRYERMDEVLFRLAWVLAAAKKEGEAREVLLRLIKDHPSSRYIPDAYLAFADFYFDQGQMDAALKFYEKVAEFPKSNVYAYAVYKKGWCQVNLGALADALATFVGVVRLTREPGANAAQKKALEKEAKKDIVKVYARVGGPDKAWEFFVRTGGDFAPKMMEALGELYWAEGQFGDSSRVYRKMIALDPGGPRLCAWQDKIVRNTQSSGSKRDQVQELERLAAVHDRRAAALPKGERDACRDALHDGTKELALVWHKEAQRTRNLETFALDRRVYELFLAHFPGDADAYDLGYYYGELLWTLGAWREAAIQYGKVVEARPAGRWVRDAAYAAVLAWQSALGVEERDRAPGVRARQAGVDAARETRGDDGPASLAPRPLPEAERQMVAAMDAFLRYVPEAPERVKIEYRKARILYESNHFAEAAPLFAAIVEQHPDDPLAIPFAANLLLDSLNALGRADEVLARVRRLLELPAVLKDKELVETLIALVSDGFEREAREHERRRDFKECGRSMLAAADASPRHAKLAERLWNAAQCFQNAHLVGQAIAAWQRLVAERVEDPLATQALFRLGAGYHQLAYYSKAADYYEAYARRVLGRPRDAR
jgi:tetratricopeptide (TPR) repeat protein